MARKRIFWFLIVLSISVSALIFIPTPKPRSFLFGIFLSDRPTGTEIGRFKETYGKSPDLVMIFLDWGKFIDQDIINAVYNGGSSLLVTWEPWNAVTKKAIDYNGLLSGAYDKYILDFALRIKAIGKPVFIRFAHEQNGNWYPWSGKAIGSSTYINMYRRVKDIFDKNMVINTQWIFAINWEDIPGDNNFLNYYPGDNYVDYVGVDGYNWGTSQSWSNWLDFKDIFLERYTEVIKNIPKPILISEFGSSSKGGDRPKWIYQAFKEISSMDKVAGVILFNVDKEADWSFKDGTLDAAALKQALKRHCF